MPGCPFYGHRWPERSPILKPVTGNECGLDFNGHGGCVMEKEGRHIDYFACPVALERRALLTAARHLVRFEKGAGQAQFLVDWETENRR